MAWTLTTSGSAIASAGADVNPDIKASGSTLEIWSNQVESRISDIVKVDVVNGFSGFTSEGKQILAELADSMIAQKMVAFDTSNYITQRSAETLLDTLENVITDNKKLIENDLVRTYMKVT